MKALEMTTFGPGGWRVIPEPWAMRVAAWRVVSVIVRGSLLLPVSGVLSCGLVAFRPNSHPMASCRPLPGFGLQSRWGWSSHIDGSDAVTLG